MISYPDNMVGRYEVGNLLVSTILSGDSDVYETAVASPYYNNGDIIIVEIYNSYSEALIGHKSWVKAMTADYEDLPEVLRTSHSTFMSLLTELAGAQGTWEKLPKEAVDD